MKEYEKLLRESLENDFKLLKNYGVPITFNKKAMINTIGIKYYLFFWRRKYYIQKYVLELTKRINENR